MSADVEIDTWLSGLGFVDAPARQQARAALEAAQLTHPGKRRISAAKLRPGEDLLRERFFLHCTTPACREAAVRSGRAPLPTPLRPRCQGCAGSDNQRMERRLHEVFQAAGLRRLVVVGGSPSVRTELAKALGERLELRLVDGTERRTAERARSDLAWADLVLLWGASELDHKVSALYTSDDPALRQKIVRVAKRGVAALLEAAVHSVERRRLPR